MIDAAPRITLATATNPGAVGMIQLIGGEAIQLLRDVTGFDDWPVGSMKLVDLAGVDRGMAVRLREDWAQLMPHGGPRVVQQLIDKLTALGATYEPNPPARQAYPEVTSDLEAEMLAAMARAASPAAIDLLLRQPALWRQWLDQHEPRSPDAATIMRQSAVLQRLIDPPTVVVIGRPNVGKSTLTNRLLGRTASVVADLPGTTRDWVAGLAELTIGDIAHAGDGAAAPRNADANHGSEANHGAVAVQWMDTPGLRRSDDPIEQEAIALANRVIEYADVLIALTDPTTGWPADQTLPRTPDIWVMNKVDLIADGGDTPFGDGAAPQTPAPLSALTGRGVDVLQQRVIDRLGLGALSIATVWAFCDTLQRLLEDGDDVALVRFMSA